MHTNGRTVAKKLHNIKKKGVIRKKRRLKRGMWHGCQPGGRDYDPVCRYDTWFSNGIFDEKANQQANRKTAVRICCWCNDSGIGMVAFDTSN